MAAEERSADASVEALLGREGAHLPFIAMVALLERLAGATGKLGGAGAPSEEPIRFRHDPSLGFSAADVRKVTSVQLPLDPSNSLSPTRPGYEVLTTFLGLTGAASPLPLYFAEEIAQEDPERPIKRQFLDLFHHRLLSLLYRGVSSYTLSADLQRDATDVWSRRLLALAGFDTFEQPAWEGRIPPARLLRVSALLAQRARPAQSLARLLMDLLEDGLEGGEVRVRQFVGKWVDIEPEQRMQLGRVNTILGQSSVVGRRVFDRAGSFDVELGPLSQEGYKRFLPEGDLLPLVQECVGLFCRDPLDYQVVLLLRQNEAPSLRLAGAENKGSRLGRDSWLGVRREQDTRVYVDAQAA